MITLCVVPFIRYAHKNCVTSTKPSIVFLPNNPNKSKFAPRIHSMAHNKIIKPFKVPSFIKLTKWTPCYFEIRTFKFGSSHKTKTLAKVILHICKSISEFQVAFIRFCCRRKVFRSPQLSDNFIETFSELFRPFGYKLAFETTSHYCCTGFRFTQNNQLKPKIPKFIVFIVCTEENSCEAKTCTKSFDSSIRFLFG